MKCCSSVSASTRQRLDKYGEFFMFVVVRIKLFGKEKLEKSPGELKNQGESEIAFSFNEANDTTRTQSRQMSYPLILILSIGCLENCQVPEKLEHIFVFTSLVATICANVVSQLIVKL